MAVRILFSKKWSAYYLAEYGSTSGYQIREIMGGKDFYSVYFERHQQIYCYLLRSTFTQEALLPEWLHFLRDCDGWLSTPIVLDEAKFLSFIEQEQNFVLTKRIKTKLLTRINAN